MDENEAWTWCVRVDKVEVGSSAASDEDGARRADGQVLEQGVIRELVDKLGRRKGEAAERASEKQRQGQG